MALEHAEVRHDPILPEEGVHLLAALRPGERGAHHLTVVIDGTGSVPATTAEVAQIGLGDGIDRAVGVLGLLVLNLAANLIFKGYLPDWLTQLINVITLGGILAFLAMDGISCASDCSPRSR